MPFVMTGFHQPCYPINARDGGGRNQSTNWALGTMWYNPPVNVTLRSKPTLALDSCSEWVVVKLIKDNYITCGLFGFETQAALVEWIWDEQTA